MGSEAARRVGLPPKLFLYSLDQIAFLLDVAEDHLKRSYLFYEGRSTGVAHKDLMIARNISPKGESPEWRVGERELVRWMRFKGFRYYERGFVKEDARRRD